jgi:hypothetical protein
MRCADAREARKEIETMRGNCIVSVVVFVALTATTGLARPVEGPKAPSPSAQVFEKLKTLTGEWEGKTVKNERPDSGRTERIAYQVIAGGTCVMETSRDGAHPDQTMATMFHMDGDALLLTHYCIAKNQPRLQATSISPDLREVVFTFRDATNLASRDKGHMDKVVIRFVDENRFTSKWTWYQEGKERWFEETEFVRTNGAATAAATPKSGGGGCH